MKEQLGQKVWSSGSGRIAWFLTEGRKGYYFPGTRFKLCDPTDGEELRLIYSSTTEARREHGRNMFTETMLHVTSHS